MDHEKYFSAEEALSRINKGSRVFVGSGCGEPQYLIEQLIALADKMFDVEILHVLSIRDPGYTATRLGDHFRIKTLKN